jgi:hypothetical protein
LEDLKKELEERKEHLKKLEEELDDKKNLLAELKDELKTKKEETLDLENLIASKEGLIEELQREWDELEAERNKPPPEPVESIYKPSKGDLVDEMLAQYINLANCPVPIKRLGDGYYMFGTRKIFAKILNGKLVIRVGGGYMVIEEFIATYAEQELAKMRRLEVKEENKAHELALAAAASPMSKKLTLIFNRGWNEQEHKESPWWIP